MPHKTKMELKGKVTQVADWKGTYLSEITIDTDTESALSQSFKHRFFWVEGLLPISKKVLVLIFEEGGEKHEEA